MKVVLGRDFGTSVEIVSGLSGDEAVILNPSDSIVAGTQVRVVKDISKENAAKEASAAAVKDAAAKDAAGKDAASKAPK
jgi:hypothetical protein